MESSPDQETTDLGDEKARLVMVSLFLRPEAQKSYFIYIERLLER